MSEDKDSLMDAVDEDAKGYVYVISLYRSDGRKFWYVGSVTTGPKGLRKRISSHKRLNGECSAPVQVNGREILLGKRDNIRKAEYDFDAVKSIQPVYDESNRHIREIERQKSIQVALDNQTKNVLGGK